MKNKWVIAVIATVFALAGWLILSQKTDAPDISVATLNGKPLSLKQLRGKVVLVNFYSSYCSFCAYEIGNLETFYEHAFDAMAVFQTVDADDDDFESLVVVLLVEGFQVADLVRAEAAIARVEIDQHHLAAHLREIEGLPREQLALQGRRGFAEFGSRFSRSGGENQNKGNKAIQLFHGGIILVE